MLGQIIPNLRLNVRRTLSLTSVLLRSLYLAHTPSSDSQSHHVPSKSLLSVTRSRKPKAELPEAAVFEKIFDSAPPIPIHPAVENMYRKFEAFGSIPKNEPLYSSDVIKNHISADVKRSILLRNNWDISPKDVQMARRIDYKLWIKQKLSTVDAKQKENPDVIKVLYRKFARQAVARWHRMSPDYKRKLASDVTYKRMNPLTNSRNIKGLHVTTVAPRIALKTDKIKQRKVLKAADREEKKSTTKPPTYYVHMH